MKNQIKSKIALFITLPIASLRMKVMIRRVNIIYKREYDERHNERENRQYVVLLSIPYIKKGKRLLKEKLYWVNRKNFRELKRRGWLPKTIRLDELRAMSFYFTTKRNYLEEQSMREYAINKYKNYIKKQMQ